VITVKTIKCCWDIMMKYRYNYWYCLILASALEHDCGILYTEDLQNGQILEKSPKIINPFAAHSNLYFGSISCDTSHDKFFSYLPCRGWFN